MNHHWAHLLFTICLINFHVFTALGQDELLNALDQLLPATTPSNQDSLLDSLDNALDANTSNLEQATSETTNQNENNTIIQQLGKNLNGSIQLRGWRFMNDIDSSLFENVDTRNHFYNAMLKLNTWSGTDDWRFNFSGWAEGGNASYNWAGISPIWQDTDERSRYLEFNELYLQYFFEQIDLTIGKRIFTNGIAPFFSPADRYTPRDYHDPLFTQKLGVWQLRADYYIEDIVLTGALFPVYQPSKSPSSHSRWLSRSLDFDFTGLTSDNDDIQLKRKAPEFSAENFGYFFQGKTTIKGWDIFSSIYYGPDPLFVLSIENLQFETIGDPIGPFAPQYLDSFDFVKSNPNVLQSAAGFSTTMGKWEIHSEALFNYSPNGRDDSYLHYLSGFTYRIGDWAKYLKLASIDLMVDYSGVWITEKQYADRYLRSFGDYRYGNSDLIGAIRFNVDEKMLFYVSTVYPMGRDDGYIQLGTRRQITEALSARFSFDHFYGPVDSDYGRWQDADRVVLTIEYKF